MAQQYPGLAVFIYAAQLVLYLIAMGLLLYGLLSGAPTHVLLYGGAYLGMCYLSGWLISGPRYLFSCLPLFLLLARPKNRIWQALTPIVSAMLLFLLCRLHAGPGHHVAASAVPTTVDGSAVASGSVFSCCAAAGSVPEVTAGR